MKLTHKPTGVALRQIQKEDANALVSLANNTKIALNLRDGFPSPYTLDDAMKFIDDAHSVQPTTRFCIEKNGVYVGNIGLHPQDDIYRMNAEIGYFIGEPFWGQGIATQAVKMMTVYGFDQLNIHRIFAGVFSFNEASKKVLINAGFTFEGVSKDAIFKEGLFYDEFRYAKLSDQGNIH